MGEFKGTKGKWNYEEIESGAGLFHCIVKKESESIVTYVMPDYDEFKANALLISKAPEMFEILEEFITHHFNFMGCSEINELQEDAKKLIKEATET